MSRVHECHACRKPGTRGHIIAHELKHHAPFTALGAVTGIVVMVAVVLARASHEVSDTLLHVLHPAHILLSALVTTSMFWQHRRSRGLAVIVGFVGSVGICSVSDIFLPYLGGLLLGAEMHLHVCFIEHWWLINPLALLGVAIGMWRPTTRFPHAAHILLSTWASLFYLTAFGEAGWLYLLPAVFVLLFVAVWLPCCFSDIVFPLLFVGRRAGHDRVHGAGFQVTGAGDD